MADLVKLIFAKPIHLAIQIVKFAREPTFLYVKECAYLESQTILLLYALRQAAKASSDLQERPARVIIDQTNHVLEKALTLVLKSRRSAPFYIRMLTFVPASSFRKISKRIINSTSEVSWLFSASPSDHNSILEFVQNSILNLDKSTLSLFLIWKIIALLLTGSLDIRSGAAESLGLLVKNDGNRVSVYHKRIIEEGGVAPLLKLVKDGNPQGQENAVRVIGLLGKDPDDVLHLIQAGVCSVFANILRKGPMKVQVMVAWALSELASNCPKCQDLFAQHDCISLLVSHLEFEIVDQEHDGTATQSSESEDRELDDASTQGSKSEDHELDDPTSQGNESKDHELDNITSQGSESEDQEHNANDIDGNDATQGRESEDTATKNSMREMAALALWHLAKDNVDICHRITESTAMLWFAILLERGTMDQQYNSAMALMEITAMVEKDVDLTRSAFKPNSQIRKAVADQLFNIIEKGVSDLLVPCVKSIGNLARTCRDTEARMISPLVRFLDDDYVSEMSKEAIIVLSKAVCHENYCCIDHSKAILSAGAARHLVELVYFGEECVQISALTLLSYICLHVPDNEELARNEVLNVIEWAERQAFLKNDTLMKLLPEARSEIELYQGIGS